MSARRPSTRGAVLALVASAFALTACEAPSPYVTLVSGSTVVKSEAAVYCFDAQTVAAGDCRTEKRPIESITLDKSGYVGIDVDKKLADAGWVATINGQQTPVQEGHWLRLNLGQAFNEQGVAQLQIFKVDGAKQTGVWQFELRRP